MVNPSGILQAIKAANSDSSGSYMTPLYALTALSSHEQANDDEARKALHEFFALVLEIDGPGELKRLLEVFHVQIQQECPADWSDSTSDGNLNAGPGVKAAANGL